MLTTPEVEAIEYAKTLDDVLVSEGINWNWVYRFTSRENAELYDKKCIELGLETRGVYPPQPGETGFSVRMRY